MLSQRDTVFIARADQADSLAEMRAELGDTPGVKVLTAGELEQRIPLLRKGYAQAGLQDSGSSEIDVAARLLTRADEMEALAAGVRDLKVLEGWRYEVFGKDALELVEGKLAFAVQSGKLKMAHIDEMQASMEEALAAE